MAMLKGETVTLYRRTASGTDALGVVVDTTEPVTVDNVLIAAETGEAVLTDSTMRGTRTVCTLYLPRGDSLDWQNSEVEFWGMRWKTFGAAVYYPSQLVPAASDWDHTVQVERYE
jgi:hypothetical protein